jgi:hypothetical protein
MLVHVFGRLFPSRSRSLAVVVPTARRRPGSGAGGAMSATTVIFLGSVHWFGALVMVE